MIGFVAGVNIGLLVAGSMPVSMSGWAYSGRMPETGSSSVIRPRSTHWRAEMVVRSWSCC